LRPQFAHQLHRHEVDRGHSLAPVVRRAVLRYHGDQHGDQLRVLQHPTLPLRPRRRQHQARAHEPHLQEGALRIRFKLSTFDI